MIPLVAAAAPQVVGGLMKIGQGIFGSRKRKREQRQAKQQFEANYSRYMGLDTSNPYKNMENTYEDLTVNQMQSQFAGQQVAQGAANTLTSLKRSAGGSGVAGLAQAIMQQQFVGMQQASADIGSQEAGNEMAKANMGAQLQTMERQGEVISRQMEQDKTETLLGMSQERLAQANQARQQATQNILGGALDVVSAGSEIVGGLMGDRASIGQ